MQGRPVEVAMQGRVRGKPDQYKALCNGARDCGSPYSIRSSFSAACQAALCFISCKFIAYFVFPVRLAKRERYLGPRHPLRPLFPIGSHIAAAAVDVANCLSIYASAQHCSLAAINLRPRLCASCCCCCYCCS